MIMAQGVDFRSDVGSAYMNYKKHQVCEFDMDVKKCKHACTLQVEWMLYNMFRYRYIQCIC